HATIWPRCKRRDGALHIAGVADIDRVHFDSKGRRQGMNCSQVTNSSGYHRITQDSDTRHTGCTFFEQLQPLSTHAEFERCKTAGIPARPRQIFDVTATDRVGNIYEYDR